MKARVINILLLLSFIVTIMAPLTGIMVHKMASLCFLLFSLIHTMMYRKQMNGKRFLVLGSIILAFLSGIFGMIYEEVPMILAFHKAISIGVVFFLAIHIFVYYKKIKMK